MYVLRLWQRSRLKLCFMKLYFTKLCFMKLRFTKLCFMKLDCIKLFLMNKNEIVISMYSILSFHKQELSIMIFNKLIYF